MPAIIGVAEQNVEGYLDRFGASLAHVRSLVNEAFGHPQHVIIGGSVPVGYANERSDLDLYVIVDGDDAPTVPGASHELGTLTDITYFGAQATSTSLDEALGHRLPPIVETEVREAYERRSSMLGELLRMGCGLTLEVHDSWEPEARRLSSAALRQAGSWAWTAEAHRRSVAARWLVEARPLAAAEVAYGALLAALKHLVMAAGVGYPNVKWLPIELPLVGRDDLAVRLGESIQLVPDPRAAARYVAETLDLVDDLIAGLDLPLVVQLTYARGVDVEPVLDGHLVSRWERRGQWWSEEVPAMADDGAAIWQQDGTDPPPDPLHQLFQDDFLWLGVARATDR